MGEIKLQLEFQKLHEFKGNFRKTHIQSSMILPECMNLTDIVLTTIFSVKLMHDCINVLPLEKSSNYTADV